MTLIKDASFLFPNDLPNAELSSWGVATKYPVPPNASMILSYLAEGSRAVGGALEIFNKYTVAIMVTCYVAVGVIKQKSLSSVIGDLKIWI